MKATTKGKGARWGPFVLGRRCKHAAAELGDIYEATHVETGAPAVVMIPRPGSTWHPKRDWQTRSFIQSSPPLVAMAMDETPAVPRLSELTGAENLLLAGLEAVGHDARMRAHLTREPVRPRKWWPMLMGMSLAGVALLALGGCVGWLSRGQDPESVRPASAVANSGLVAPKFAARTSPDPTAIAYPLPAKPFRNQATAPCPPERDESEINGGCWVVLKRRPPCLSDQAEYKGECYLPVALDRGPKLPQSLTP